MEIWKNQIAAIVCDRNEATVIFIKQTIQRGLDVSNPFISIFIGSFIFVQQ